MIDIGVSYFDEAFELDYQDKTSMIIPQNIA